MNYFYSIEQKSYKHSEEIYKNFFRRIETTLRKINTTNSL